MSADATMADATLDVSIDASHNGCPDPFELVEPFGFARADLVRLMMQCLSSLGYEHAVKSLQQESGIHLFSEPIARFRDCVLCGDWDAAKSVVDHLGFSTLATKLAVQFMLGRQKYLELLEAQRTDAALACLRDELAPLEHSRKEAEAAAESSAAASRAAAAACAAAAAADAAAAAAAGTAADAAAPAAAAHAAATATSAPAGAAPAAAPCSSSTAIFAAGASSSTPAPAALPPTLCRLGSSIRELSAYLMTEPSELIVRTGWDGAAGTSRAQLLAEIQRRIPPSTLLPDHRLQTLLQQAICWQASQCVERPTSGTVGMMTSQRSGGGGSRSAGSAHRRALLEDLAFSREEIPSLPHGVLEQHQDEVWLVQFAHGSAKLASASKDGVVIVWGLDAIGAAAAAADGQTAAQQRQCDAGGEQHGKALCGHTDSVAALSWSPDDESLLTCSADQTIKLWAASTGSCVRTFSRHTESVTSVAWLPCGRGFLSASADRAVCAWNVRGEVLSEWHGARVTDLAVSSTGTRFVAASEMGVRVGAIEDESDGADDALRVRLSMSDEPTIPDADGVACLCLSRDSTHCLTSVPSGRIRLWHLDHRTQLAEYCGHKSQRFVIRAAFGGADEDFVISGSEDSRVYIWHRHTAALLEVLSGHSGAVNTVAWSSSSCPWLASASDDHTVRVWRAANGALETS